MEQRSGRVLLVDDDTTLRNGYERALARHGWTVDTAGDGLEAKERLKTASFDVIVSDIQMAGYGGVEFLRAVRDLGLDVPVILMTGKPTMNSTISAVEHGAFRYLIKPIGNEALDEVVAHAARLSKLAALKRQALELHDGRVQVEGDRAALTARFQSALDRMWVAFQPIVCWREREVFGYEALLRTDEATMASPLDFLDAAEKLGRLHEVGRTVRAKVAECAPELPAGMSLFVNLHASDLDDVTLFDTSSPFAKIAQRVVLEVTERSSLDAIKDLSGRVKMLRGCGFRVAIDDLGAGYAGLTSFTQLDPEVAKLDMSLVRGIDTHLQKQSIVRAMKSLCDELRIAVVAEGVETAAERDMLVELGCDLLQGYLFARPGRGFPAPSW
jgi:EAL domain-containing protein (putative c-di-GMP-specific phosphodiesterase class I)